jgi:hypothetical protein
MGRAVLPTTLVFCCPLPAGMPATQIAAGVDAVVGGTTRVTLAVALEQLEFVVERQTRAGGPVRIAVDVPVEVAASRQALRRLLAAAGAAAPGIDAAMVRGTLPQDCRRMLVDGGIGVVLRDRLEAVSRGARRPAPGGWPCRSVLWGLWEVAATDAGPPGIIDRLLWRATEQPQPGGLTVVNLTSGSVPTAASIRDRLERWHAWIRRQPPGTVEVADVAALPELITGAGRRPLAGSVLRAA